MPFAAVLTAFALTSFFGLGVLKFFPKWGLMDRPERYGHRRDPIPYPGGSALVLGIVLTILLFLPMDPLLGAVISGTLILALTCFVDDRRGLSPVLRLFVQALAGLLIVIGGAGILSISNPFGAALSLEAIKIPLQLGDFLFEINVFADVLTVLWVMVMINAFNWIDGVPGMTSGVAAVASFILLMLSVRPEFHFVDQTLAITLSAAILGASLAMLIFDFPPPRMLMGDTGSMVLGFLLAVTAIVSGGKIATTILVLGFPLLDFAWVIGRRLSQGKSPMKGDLWHFHHRLLKGGFTPRQVVLFFMVTAGLFGSLSLMLQTEGKVLAFISLIGVMSLIGLLLYRKQ
jgi:UDP-GlcNAc:undecaprenyl-phosphate GlcNAc-1-phosphate transferase